MENSNNMCLGLLLLWLFIFYSVGECVISICKQENVPLFIFGDSKFDTGNNNYINTTIRSTQSNYPPYGQFFFNYPSGRWSDGRVVPDFYAEYANLPLILPYLYPGNKRYVDGINFASGGSGALDETLRAIGVISLNTQARNFKEVVSILRKQLGTMHAKILLSRGVYLTSVGANDYRTFASGSRFFSSLSNEEYVDLVIGNLTSVINEIHENGGRKFAVMNIWSFRHLPSELEAASRGNNTRLKLLNQLGELHNKQLHKALEKLSTKREGFRYSYVDSYKVFEELTSNPAKYGLTEVKEACCGSGEYRGIQSCGGLGFVKEYELCDNPKEHLFFDSNHGTDKTYQILAEMTWNGVLNTSFPVNVKSLFNY